ncbi:GTPase-associated system all-helical protein GASH [Mesorhizobium sp.]|uniref:GTPase-associated system all-helical protein GASH n=1 Tax=Mesorhizobium sp. TaxID=1871066 RepID=UPI000FE592A3|nr:GTPase-associated system all-helical protein GASH [Mesorhizobium sp.]RWP76623.1 MAG: hypothetical protein EOR09_10780 [Mesorhizobium sp.]
MAVFDFVSEYRGLQPTAEREQITARSASFEKAMADANGSIDRVIDLAYFAYRLPIPVESDASQWFGSILRTDDPTFSIDLDIEETARIATLVLRRRLYDNFITTPIIVHSAAFAGKRQTVDKHGLSYASRQTLADLVKRRGSSVTRPQISSGKAGAISELIKKLGDGSGETENVQVFEAILEDYNSQIKQVVTSANKAVETAWTENRRLAEEIDLLWWHLGGHSYLLDRPIAEIPALLRPAVVGMDIGEMISAAPGPHGTYGIIRKALGETADETFKLGDVVKELSRDFSDLISNQVSRYAIAPVHGVFGDVLLGDTPVVGAQFKRRAGLALDTKLTGYELAVQAYHERMLKKLGHV